MGKPTSLRSIAALLLAVTLAGCATTSFVSTWKAPDAGPVTLEGKRVAAMVVSPNDGTRRSAEDALAREITARGATGVPAYTLVDSRNFKDEAAARAALQKSNIDGVVVMRAVGSDTEVTYTPGMWTAGPMYGRFWGGGYWGYGWGAAYDPGYLRTDKIVNVETLAYTMTDDKLIWASMSRTTNPANVDSFVRELATAVANEMRKEGVLR